LPCPLPQRSLRGTRAAPGSTYNRTAIPRVLPGCKHNKRERHRVVRCQVGSLYDVQAAEQTAHPKSGPRRRPGITSDRCTQIGEQPEKGSVVTSSQPDDDASELFHHLTDTAGDELFTFLRFPSSQWKALRTTNALERINEEFRRRTKTQASLPGQDAVV